MAGLVFFFKRLCSREQTPSIASTRPGLFESVPDERVALLGPGCQVSAALTGPDGGVVGLKSKLGDLDIPWQQHASTPTAAAQPPQQQQQAWGDAISLYDKDTSSGRRNGDPIADCYGVITYQDAAVLALADGVNWGERPRLAARAAVHGFLRHVHNELALKRGAKPISSNAAFSIIQGAVSAAQQQVLASGGTLTTLVGALVLPQRWGQQHSLLSVVIGDSPAYVWRAGQQEVEDVSYQPPRHGFHRDPRVCPGCLGFAAGDAPDLSNISYSITSLAPGDVVYLASDGVADNFDPVIRKQASARAIGEGSSRLPGVNALSPATCHKMAVADMAGVLKDACRQQQGTSRPSSSSGGQAQHQHQQQQQQGLPSDSIQQQQPQPQPQQQHCQAADMLNATINSEGGWSPVPPASPASPASPSSSSRAPLDVIDGTVLTAQAAVTSLLDFVVEGTAAQRALLEGSSAADKASSAADKASSDALADEVANLPGKLDHAAVVAYKVVSRKSSSKGSSSRAGKGK